MRTELDDPRETAARRQRASIHRRSMIRGAMGGVLVALLSSPGRARAQGAATPNDPFILLLQGIYSSVDKGPDLGLSSVDLSDGTYSTTKIYPAFGVSTGVGGDGPSRDTIGNFFVQIGKTPARCAYQLPEGAMAMQFTSGGFAPHDDGQGGQYMEGTFELDILEATGIYAPFQGGHNHMVDRLHKLSNGQLDESCFCVISQYQFP